MTLFRDHHGWCGYCQKIWFFLEEMRIPYQVFKVCLHSFSKQKEEWYKEINPDNYVPSAEVDGKLYTQADEIIVALEHFAGKLGGVGLTDPRMKTIRDLEAGMLAGWWGLIAYECESVEEEEEVVDIFKKGLWAVEDHLGKNKYLLGNRFTLADVLMVPFMER